MRTTMATENNNKTLNVPNLRFPEFSGEWGKTKFENIVSLQRGSSPRPIIEYITKSEDGVNWVKIGDMPASGRIVTRTEEKITREGAKKSRHVKIGDLILSNSMSFGQPYIMGIEGYIHDGWFVLRNYEKSLVRDYLCNLLISPSIQQQYKRLAAGGVVQNISSELVNSVIVSVPTKTEQKKIAEFISYIDDRIATQIKIIEKFESLIKGLYERLFNIDGAAYIQLGNVAKIQKGQQINGKELSEIGSYYVMNGGVVPSGYLEDFNTPANTISISEGGNSCGYVQYNGVPFWSGGHCYTLIEPINSFNYKYLFNYLKFKEQSIMALRIGSGLPNIQKKDLERFPILNVSKEEQDKMACIFDDILDRIICERQIALKYEEQKKYLLSNLFI